MKCEYCSGTLTLEDEYCPYCGQPNKHAKQHIKDMQRYHGEFEETKSYVYEKTGRYTSVTVRVVIIAVLVVLILLSFFLGGTAWEICSGIREAKANRNYAAYSAKLDEYLAEEDYLDFYAFCMEKGIRSYDGPYDDKYGLLIQLTSTYTSLYNALFSYVTVNEDSGSYVLDGAADCMEYFYKYYLDEDEYYTEYYDEDELFRQVVDTMEYNVEQILITYGGFTQEEAASLPELSNAKRAVLLEEKMEALMQNE